MFRVVGISFDHMHMGDLLRQVHEHPEAEIAGIFDPDRGRMQSAVQAFGIATSGEDVRADLMSQARV